MNDDPRLDVVMLALWEVTDFHELDREKVAIYVLAALDAMPKEGVFVRTDDLRVALILAADAEQNIEYPQQEALDRLRALVGEGA